jgi:peptidoglycan/xylan/chitin deacetylase (PgdA/CDA1 family)/GT2 family glycosyltransferase
MISVIVPAYNRGDTINATLESLLAQTYEDWRAIVVDDGSTDATVEVAERYGQGDGRISVHRQAKGGVGRARNAAIALAESPWLFFLDADDWIVPFAFERLIAVIGADPRADAIYGGYVRVDDAGLQLPNPLPEDKADQFACFAKTCAISIHTCLVRTEIVRAAGGFDESLVTCEDWDLWQRIARIGARFAAIPDYIAFYRMRAGSASGKGWRMLEDGLLVIDRGHGKDPRLSGSQALERPSLSKAARDTARTYFACYTAGLEIAAGNDARDMIAKLGDDISADVDPHGVAETLFYAIPVGRAMDPSRWASFPERVHELCRLFIEALGARLDRPWLAFGARNELERMLLAETPAERPCRAGRWYLTELDVDGPAPADLQLEPDVERLLCKVHLGEVHIEDVEVPVIDGWVPARVLADAVAAPLAWEILQAFFERHVYPSLQIELTKDGAHVARDGFTLFEGALDPTRTAKQGVHDAIGWTILLQELWGITTWSSDDFYAAPGRVGRSAPARRVGVDEARVEVDVAEPLPSLRLQGRDSLVVAVKLAGVPLTVMDCQARKGLLSAQDLRRAILMQTGYELCRAVVREAVLLAPTDASGSLGERLSGALAASRSGMNGSAGGESVAVPHGATVIGSSPSTDGTAASRWSVLPAEAAHERIALARRDGVSIVGRDTGHIERLLAAPVVAGSEPDRRRLSDDALLRSIEFERIFGGRANPWHYESDYEQEKYRQTLSLLPDRVARALELGCAEGMFTHKLAERVGSLTAADISLLAISRAGRACADCRNVVFTQMDAFGGSIGGPYDLIVCSEMLYYADSRSTLERTVRALAAAIEPGGHLLTAHAHVLVDDRRSPGFDWDVPFGAATIEQALLGTRTLDLEEEIRTPAYRVQRYRRRSRRRLLAARSSAVGTMQSAGELVPEHAARFLANGGSVRRETVDASTPKTSRVPILMYHRVATEGASATRRWRVHPEDFEAQLRYLRENGYHSLTFEQWRVASDRREPIPARAVILTFDDGYADFPTHALPLLGKYGFHATMFVVTDLVGGCNVWDESFGEKIELMDWPALVSLREQGIELGSHSSLHRPLVSLSATELARDLCRSRECFHERFGVAVRSVCYPYGLHDACVLSLAGACGFHYGVTTNEWQASFGDDLLGLPRIEVRGTDTLPEFTAKLSA